MVIDLYFGIRDQLVYCPGAFYAWAPEKSIVNGGRPVGGNLDGEGYSECPLCHKDFFVVVKVRNDVLVGAEPDLSKSPLIPD